MSSDKWDLLAALPFLAAAGGILFVAVSAAGGTAIRLKRRQQQRRRDEAERRATGATPWNQWLNDINALAEKTKDRA